MKREYEVQWVPGMGRGLASHIQSIANANGEKGWRLAQVIVDDAGVQHGALVILERER